MFGNVHSFIAWRFVGIGYFIKKFIVIFLDETIGSQKARKAQKSHRNQKSEIRN